METHDLAYAGPVSARLVSAGPDHPDIRALLDARRGRGSAHAPDGVLVEGVWAHRLLLERRVRPDITAWCPDADGDERVDTVVPPLLERARAAYRISPRTLGRLSARSRPDGLVSLVRLPRRTVRDVQVDPRTVLLVADGIRYAGNLGTLIRNVDACGASGLLLARRQVRLTHPMVFTASRGALLTTTIVEFDGVAAALTWLRSEGFRCVLATPDAERDYRDFPYDGPIALVVGSEGDGVSPDWSTTPHESVSIPMSGTVDSLNVAVAAGILLFEACRRRAPDPAGQGTTSSRVRPGA